MSGATYLHSLHDVDRVSFTFTFTFTFVSSRCTCKLKYTLNITATHKETFIRRKENYKRLENMTSLGVSRVLWLL
jgi:hypothetical protein